MTICKTDDFGDRAVAVFGDSITHGANCPDIPGQSYIGLLKQRLEQKGVLRNYGFVSMEWSMRNACGRYDELHQVRQGIEQSWREERQPDNLGSYGLVSDRAGLTLEIALSRPYQYAYVYYTATPDGGVFTVRGGGRPATVNTRSRQVEQLRAGPFCVADQKLTIESADNRTVTITGMGYYNDLNGPVVNNYANNGLRLVGLGDDLIGRMARADTVIFSLGYNDSHFPTRKFEFVRKIDLLIAAVRQYGAKLYVNDFCWALPEGNHFRHHLRRLAEKTNGVFIAQTDQAGRLDPIGAHPDAEGHRRIAEALIRAMGL